MRTVIHADDFGATHNVNANILKTWRAGGLDSISIIANGDALTQGATEVLTDSNRPIRLMVHLNLSEGHSCADPSAVPLLVNSAGLLNFGFIGLWKKWITSSKQHRIDLLTQIELEWRTQIEKVISSFKPLEVSGVDGHIHIHMLPFLFPIAAKLANEYQLSEIRISREILHFSIQQSFSLAFPINLLKHVLLRQLSQPAVRIANQLHLVSPDVISGVIYSGCMNQNTALAAIKAAKKSNVQWLEILFHPGRATPNEMPRWLNQPGIGHFYLDKNRDIECGALIEIGNNRHLFR